MDVILLQDVDHVGLKGDVVDVKRGYARNYLLPRRLAEAATPGALAHARAVDAQRARQEARTADQAQEIAAILGETVLRFDVKSGPTGSLFGSVTATDVAEELWRARKVRVDRRKLEMDSIKRIGRYTITVHLFDGVTADVRALVVPEGGELPPEEELAAMEAAEQEAEAAEAETRKAEAEIASEELERELAAEEAAAEAEPEPSGQEAAETASETLAEAKTDAVET
jgi:large subunit ribosomal protein L9